MTQIIQTPKQQTYLSKLLGYDYTIECRSSSSNAVVDALSRISPQGQCLTLYLPTFKFLGELRTSLHQSSTFLNMWNMVRTSPTDHLGYSIRRELLFYHDKLWLPSYCSFIPLLLDEFHSTPFGGTHGHSQNLSPLTCQFRLGRHAQRCPSLHFSILYLSTN